MNAENQSVIRLAKGFGIIFAGMFISKILGYVYRVYIARHFGPEAYGLFSLGLAVTGIVFTISLLGLFDSVVRYTSYYRIKNETQKLKGVITSSFKIVLLLSATLSAFLYIMSYKIALELFNKPELILFIKILAVSIPFYCLSNLTFAIFRGFQKPQYEAYLYNIFSNLAKVVIVLIVGFYTKDLYNIAWSWTIAWILTLLLSLYFLEKRVFHIFKTKIKSISMKKKLLHFSLPLLFTGIMWMIITWTDTIVLGYYKSSSVVGIYNAALPTSVLLLTIPIAFMVMFMPVITGLYAGNKVKEIGKLYKTITRWVFYINFPLFLIIALFSKQILNILFGAEYVSGYQALIILGFGFMFGSLLRASYFVLGTIKKTKYIMYNSLIAASLNLILNIYLVPKYALVGAAFATATSFIVLRLLSTVQVWHFLKMFPLSKDMVKSLFSGIMALTIINYVSGFFVVDLFHIVFLFVFYYGIYSLLLLLFRGINKEDMVVIAALEKKFNLNLGFIKKILMFFTQSI